MIDHPSTSTERASQPAGSFKLSLFFLVDHYPERGESLPSRYRQHLERCVEAESLGFEGVFFAEHHFSDFGTAPNPAIFLSAVAAKTQRIRLGPAVTILPFRDPMQVVEDYAMVDQISSGRLVLGVGSGSVPEEFHGFGLCPENKREVFEQRLQVVEDLLHGRPGPHGAPANVLGAGGRIPPIFLATTKVEGARAAGLGGYGLLTLASPGTSGLGEIVERIQSHRAGIEASSNPRPNRESIVTIMAHFAENAEQAREEAAPALERFLHAHGGEGADGFEVYDSMVERGVGAFGTPGDVLERLATLAASGVDHLCLWMGFGDMDSVAVEKAMGLATRLMNRRSMSQHIPVGRIA